MDDRVGVAVGKGIDVGDGIDNSRTAVDEGRAPLRAATAVAVTSATMDDRGGVAVGKGIEVGDGLGNSWTTVDGGRGSLCVATAVAVISATTVARMSSAEVDSGCVSTGWLQPSVISERQT